MKKPPKDSDADELRPEYDFSKLGPGVRGKYHERALAGTNLVLIEPELADVFPDSASVNRALRLLLTTAEAAARPGQRARKRPKRAPAKTAASVSRR